MLAGLVYNSAHVTHQFRNRPPERDSAIPEQERRAKGHRYRRGHRHFSCKSTPLPVGACIQGRDHDVPFDQVRKGQENRGDKLPFNRIHPSSIAGQEIKGAVENIVAFPASSFHVPIVKLPTEIVGKSVGKCVGNGYNSNPGKKFFWLFIIRALAIRCYR
jgi:hypothetical protein